MERQWLILLLVLGCILSACNIPTPIVVATPLSLENTATLTSTLAQDPITPTAFSTPTPTVGATLIPSETPQPAQPASTSTSSALAGPLTVTNQIVNEDTKAPALVLDVEYPIFTDASGQPVEGLNTLVADMINHHIQDFKDAVQTATPPAELIGGQNGLYIKGYEVRQNGDGYVSIYFPVSEYFLGQAHPTPGSETINYDLRQNRSMQLADLFKPGVDYVSILSQKCKDDLQNQGVLQWDDGVKPEEQNFKNWNLTSAGLVITIDPGYVTAYAVGYQKVVLPWSGLADSLNPDLGLK